MTVKEKLTIENWLLTLEDNKTPFGLHHTSYSEFVIIKNKTFRKNLIKFLKRELINKKRK